MTNHHNSVPTPNDVARVLQFRRDEQGNPITHVYPAGDCIHVIRSDGTFEQYSSDNPVLQDMARYPHTSRDARWAIGFYATKPSSERQPVSAKTIDRLAKIARRSVDIKIQDSSTDDSRVHFTLTGPPSNIGVAGAEIVFDLDQKSFDMFADRALIEGALAHQKLAELASTASALSRQQLAGSLVALTLTFPQKLGSQEYDSGPIRLPVGRVVTNKQADAILTAFRSEKTGETTTSNDPGPHKTYRRAV